MMTNLNEQPAKIINHSLETLTKIKSGAVIVSVDGVEIGTAVKIHKRLEDVDSALKLYLYYVECIRPQMGDTGFIPADFIDEISSDGNKVVLSATIDDFNGERWDVRPPFIAHDKNKTVQLI